MNVKRLLGLSGAVAVAVTGLGTVSTAQAAPVVVPSYTLTNDSSSDTYVETFASSSCAGSRVGVFPGGSKSSVKSFRSFSGGFYKLNGGTTYTLTANKCYNAYGTIRTYTSL